MNSVKINDISKFMSLLFSSEALDKLYISEGVIETFATYRIDGYSNKAYFDDSDSPEEYSRWAVLRPLMRELIKGKKLPVSIRLTLFLPLEIQCNYVEGEYSGIRFIINVRYENGELHLISATSTQTFTLDKRFEKQWDAGFEKFLGDLKIDFEKDL